MKTVLVRNLKNILKTRTIYNITAAPRTNQIAAIMNQEDKQRIDVIEQRLLAMEIKVRRMEAAVFCIKQGVELADSIIANPLCYEIKQAMIAVEHALNMLKQQPMPSPSRTK